MRTTDEINENVRVVSEHRFLVRKSLADAKERRDIAAITALETGVARIDRVMDSLRRELNKAGQKATLNSPEFHRRASFREKLAHAKGVA